MDDFVLAHHGQLQTLNIPRPLYEGLKAELESSFNSDGSLKKKKASAAPPSLAEDDAGGSFAAAEEYHAAARYTPSTEYGKMLVIPHLCSWDIVENPSRGLWEALRLLPTDALQQVHQGLEEFWGQEYNNDDKDSAAGVEGSTLGASSSTSISSSSSNDKQDGEEQFRMVLMDSICHHCWTHVILYRSITKNGQVRAALPTPPYFPQVSIQNEADPKEAALTGPFPFQYHIPNTTRNGIVVETSLVYLSPDFSCSCLTGVDNGGGGGGGDSHRPPRLLLPTIDLVPMHSVKNTATRAVRYAALLGSSKLAPPTSVAQTKEMYANFAHRMHLARQEKLNNQQQQAGEREEAASSSSLANGDSHHQNGDKKRILKVYTDHGDPLQLAHPQAGLDPAHYCMTDSMEEADIIYSYDCLFSPGATRELIETRWASNVSNEASSSSSLSTLTSAAPLINQFPYEGAMVSKDHLARGILQQHGLPLPTWALESYDLDVHLAEFVGSCLLAKERGEDPIWIVKPARLTQSRGHVVTRSTAQILRLLDAGGGASRCSRVAQRYIQNPVTYDGRKVDCRCLVMMVSATKGNPSLFMHKRVYFRIANKEHSISSPGGLFDNETILTATHLLDESRRTTTEALKTLPVDYKTIAKLEEDYPGQFDWKHEILPKIHTLVRELFGGMTAAYPAMEKSIHSRAIYGIDIMFEIDDSGAIEPRLTEVTFCPSNNAICDGYERDEELYKSYNTEVFDCLFRSVVSENITVI